MGGCLSSPAAAEAQQAPVAKEKPVLVHSEVPLKAEKQQLQQQRPEPSAAPAITPPAAVRGGELSKSWGRLNQTETVAVQQTLLKVRAYPCGHAHGCGAPNAVSAAPEARQGARSGVWTGRHGLPAAAARGPALLLLLAASARAAAPCGSSADVRRRRCYERLRC